MVYHKQASVASVMYKYLIRFLGVSAVPEEVHRWPSPARFTSASWDPACHVGRGTLVREESSAGPLHLCCGDEWDRNGDQEEKWSPAVTFVLLFILVSWVISRSLQQTWACDMVPLRRWMGPERGSGREVITSRNLRFTFYFGILGYFTFVTTNLSLRYGSVLS